MRGLIFGPPGSGKGTLAKRLLRDVPGLVSISSGDALRSSTAARHPAGVRAQRYMDRGELVPDEIMLDLMRAAMAAHGAWAPGAGFLLDGFPRSLQQAPELDRLLAEHGEELNLVVHLDVPDAALIERVEHRLIHPGSGRVYNLNFDPPRVPGRDDVTGEPLVRRSDDQADVLRQRLASFRAQTLPLLGLYRARGLCHSLRGTSSDELYPGLLALVQGLGGDREGREDREGLPGLAAGV